MSANNLEKTFFDTSESDIVEEQCEMNNEQQDWTNHVDVVREKRLRSSSDDILDEDGFTTVRSKRLMKSQKKVSTDEFDNLPNQEEKIIVTLTGKEVLPKQFKMAKLLRSENISNIINIQYKSPFKIIVQFENEESAQKLIKCTKIIDMGLRCQLSSELSNFTYGIIRNVDLDIEIEEIKDNIESDFEIVSLRRLKRTTATGKWIDSETVRICFKSTTLPPFVHGYGCRFKVEPYMFPVSQCSGCWRYGHGVRFCPTRKIVCPKCSEYHPNCETTKYKCINCKGNHMALDKSCPVFLKEKNIRIIMRDLHYTYRKALTVYLNENKPKNSVIENLEMNCTGTDRVVENKKSGRSYREVLMSHVGSDAEESSDEADQENENTIKKQRAKRNKKSNKRNKSNERAGKNDDNIVTEDSDTGMGANDCVDENKGRKEKSDRKKGITFMKILQKIKEVFMSESTLEDKIKKLISYIIEVFVKYISTLCKDNNIVTWLLSTINYG